MTDDRVMGEATARVRAAGDQFSAALLSAMNLAFRRAMIRQIEQEFGPGPWVVHPDGGVQPVDPVDAGDEGV